MYEQLIQIIKDSDNIVFFGGAAVSTESNIPDFRSSNGIFNEKTNITYPPETVVSHSFLIKNTEFFYDFYKSKMIYEDALPNKAHKALAKLEEIGKLKAVITQNIDGLHQMAGSKNVLELHGSIHENYCVKCHTNYGLDYIVKSKGVPLCEKCDSLVRPNVVLYEESLDSDVIQKSVDYISKADVLIIGGTSLIVYPASGLVNYFRGKQLVVINKSTTSQDDSASLVINDSIGKVLDEVIKQL